MNEITVAACVDINTCLKEIKVRDIVEHLKQRYDDSKDDDNDAKKMLQEVFGLISEDEQKDLSEFEIGDMVEHIIDNTEDLDTDDKTRLVEALSNDWEEYVAIDTGRDKISIRLEKGNMEDVMLCEEFAEKMSVTNPNQLILL